MGKRILITEEEKNKIKEMHNLNEDWVYDLLTFIKKKGTSAAKSIWNKITGKDKEEISKEDIEKLSPEEKEKMKKEMEKDNEDKDETPKKKIDKKEKENTGKWVTEGRYCYFKPDGYKGGKAHLLMCGNDTSPTNLSKASKKYTSNIGSISDIIFVMTDYKNTVSAAKSWISKNLNAEVTSIAGFSAGGYDVWPLVGSNQYKMVGLIDPSTGNNYAYDKIYKNFGSNTFLVCDPSNWGAYPNTKKNLEKYCENESKSNGRIYCTDSGHHGQLGIFYEKYSSRL